eukprot:CAMPEP_0174740562 /NCGR_PEP_ID=MMETSP1094-20130205/73892_1 /TAXON_ID=156173 /ORGANISM="Chrysochromulina brevifilum, Strain UTEX LB 985" /LENGTH=66 /DNA_ID=CAMNT_0015944281 /DNA_START=112 /DNA_END=309 /DNA_ORIENTATION=+
MTPQMRLGKGAALMLAKEAGTLRAGDAKASGSKRAARTALAVTSGRLLLKAGGFSAWSAGHAAMRD